MKVAHLQVVSGAKSGQFAVKLPTTIGRGTSANLTVPHPLVSRLHCKLFVKLGRLAIRDLGSLNGTYVNNRLIDRDVELSPGDVIRIGEVELCAVAKDRKTLVVHSPMMEVSGDSSMEDTGSYYPPVAASEEPSAAADKTQPIQETVTLEAATLTGFGEAEPDQPETSGELSRGELSRATHEMRRPHDTRRREVRSTAGGRYHDGRWAAGSTSSDQHDAACFQALETPPDPLLDSDEFDLKLELADELDSQVSAAPPCRSIAEENGFRDLPEQASATDRNGRLAGERNEAGQVWRGDGAHPIKKPR